MAAAPQEALFVDHEGATVAVPVAQAQDAVAQGFIPANAEQATAFHAEEAAQAKYGGLGQQIATGVESAADVATFGASRWAERGLGIATAEEQSERKRINPDAATAGTVAGVALPAIATLGTSAEAQGALGAVRTAAELAPMAGVSRLGAAGVRAAEAALPAATTFAGRIAQKAATSAVGSAIEGAALGVGNVVSEAALGDPHLTAEGILSEVGMGALSGGVLGGGTGALFGLAKEATTGKIGVRLAEWLGEVEGERNIKAAGAIKSDVARAVKQKGEENLNAIGREMGEMGLVTPFSTPAKVAERAEEMLAKEGPKFGTFLADTEAKAAAKGIASGVDARDFLTRAGTEAIAPLADNPLQKAAAERLAGIVDDFGAKYAGTPGMPGRIPIEELHVLRRQLDKEIFGHLGNKDPGITAFADGLSDLRRSVKGAMEDSITAMGGDLREWKALNRRYEVAATAEKFGNAGALRAQGNNALSLTETMAGMTGLIHGNVPGALLSTAAGVVGRRFSAGVLGAGARAARGAVEDRLIASAAQKALPAGERALAEQAASVVSHTASAIASQRQGGQDSVAQGATSARETVAALAHLERNNQQLAARVTSGVSTLVNGSVRGSSVGRSEIAPGVSRGFGKSLEANTRTFEKRAELVRRLAGDPEQMMAAVTAQADELHEHAPDTSTALAAASARAVGFLASKLPVHPSPGPLAAPWAPSQSEISTFHRYYETVENPGGVLKQAAAGTLTPEAVEAVRTVYPALYASMQTAVMDKLASRSTPPTYRVRQMLGMLLGQDLDGSSAPATLAANQAAFGGPPQDSGGLLQGGVNETSDPSAVTLADRSLTPSQKSKAS